MPHPLTSQLHQASNPTQSVQMAAYMRDQFPFLGIKAPVRERIVNDWLKAQTAPDDVQLLEWVEELYELPEREFQYAACDLLKARARHLNPAFWLPHVANYITIKSWWDTVDVWAPKVSTGLLLKSPGLIESYPSDWIKSDNFWLQRAAIIFQLNYRQKMNLPLLFDCCRCRMDSEEFFVQKAIGWALRSASRHFPTETKAFLLDHKEELRPLSLREGSKLLKKQALWP